MEFRSILKYFFVIVATSAYSEAMLSQADVQSETSLSQDNCSIYPFSQELQVACDLAKEVGLYVKDVRDSGEMEIYEKDVIVDGKIEKDPVTNADMEANRMIMAKLKKVFPDHGFLGEESEADTTWQNTIYTWVVDPIDGTKDYKEGGKEYGVHIALLEDNAPLVGVNYYPSLGVSYYAARDQGAFKQVDGGAPVKITAAKDDSCINPIKTSSVKEMLPFYSVLFAKKLTEKDIPSHFGIAQSTGLRLCQIAEGKRSHLIIPPNKAYGAWDFASGAVILKEAGACIGDWEGNLLNYRPEKGLIKPGVLVAGNKELFDRSVTILKILKKGP